MKFRSTRVDLSVGYCVLPCSSVSVSGESKFYHPLPNDEMDHYKEELPANKFNGLSLADAKLFSELRGMDKLHKADVISRMYKRSLNLRSQVSKSDFLTHY